MKTYIITGMGRSGSTFLAESLEKNGVDLGKDKWYTQRENVQFVELNKRIYAEFGIAGNMGDMPPTLEQILSVKEKYINEFRMLYAFLSLLEVVLKGRLEKKVMNIIKRLGKRLHKRMVNEL